MFWFVLNLSVIYILDWYIYIHIVYYGSFKKTRGLKINVLALKVLKIF